MAGGHQAVSVLQADHVPGVRAEVEDVPHLPGHGDLLPGDRLPRTAMRMLSGRTVEARVAEHLLGQPARRTLVVPTKPATNDVAGWS